jgi:hypothetical protein
MQSPSAPMLPHMCDLQQPLQAWPQPLQLLMSDGVHTPPQQKLPASQLWPHMPQFFGSSRSDWQPSLQHACLVLHAGPPLHWQAPPTHSLPSVQAGLHGVSTQLP